jgi:hypothetical protein
MGEGMGMKYCKCGCGERVKHVWYSEDCRNRFRHIEKMDADRRRSYAQERVARTNALKALPTHTVMARVHTMNQDDETLVKEQVVTVPIPKLNLWGY